MTDPGKSKLNPRWLIASVVAVGGVLLLISFLKPDLTKTEHGRALLLARQLGTPAQFRKVIERFPNTRSAELALRELPPALLREADGSASPDLYRALIEQFPQSREAAKARAVLPSALLDKARKQQSVSAYLALLTEFPSFPDAPRVREDVHQLYTRALEQFKSHFTGESDQVRFVSRILAHLENTGNPIVDVRFVKRPKKTPNAEDNGPITIEYEYILSTLRHFFDDLGHGTLELKQGEPIPDSSALISATRPTIGVDCSVTFNGNTYGSSSSNDMSFGQDVAIKVSMRTPGEASGIDISSSGRTPARFDVSGGESSYMKARRLAIHSALTRLQQKWIPSRESRTDVSR